MKNGIVITGMGAVTPIGIGVESFWRGITEGACGIGPITRIDTTNLQIHRAGEVKGFDPKAYMSSKLAMDLEPFMQYAFVAAGEAMRQSGLTGSARAGCVMGTALAGIAQIEGTASSDRPASPKFLVKAMGNMAPARFAIEHGITGPCLTVTTACSSGGDALYLARLLLESGAADAVVAMAGEAAITTALVSCLTRIGALSKSGESRPFDAQRNGFVLGEGGGAMVLEREDCARARGAKPLARLLGCANNNDAYNPVSPEPDGAGAAECMRLALGDAGLKPGEIDYLNAHGTATSAGDIAESKAIRAAFGEDMPYVSSTKGATGHMMGAGGLLELIACAQAIRSGVMPVNLGMREQDPLCDLKLVRRGDERASIRTAMSNSMGFGGQNSCVILGKYEEKA